MILVKLNLFLEPEKGKWDSGFITDSTLITTLHIKRYSTAVWLGVSGGERRGLCCRWNDDGHGMKHGARRRDRRINEKEDKDEGV